jgi:tetratricopeptide (TPR) repeat protein
MRSRHFLPCLFAAFSFGCLANTTPASDAIKSVPETEALTPFTVVPPKVSESAANYFRLGYQSMKAGRYPEAQVYLDKAVKADPGPAALAMRGQIYAATGQYQAALGDFTSVLAQDPRRANVLLLRGDMYYMLKDLPHALVEFNAALAIEPDLALAYMGRGQVFEDMHQPGSAADDYVLAARLIATTDRSAAASLYQSAVFQYNHDNRKKDAIACVDAALKLTPEAAVLYAMRGDLEKKIYGPGKALIDYQTAIRLDPSNIEARDRVAKLFEDTDQLQASLDEFNEILKTPQKNPDWYLDRANVLMDMARDSDALPDYEIAEKLNPFYPRVKHQRMQLRFYQGDYAGAVRDADAWLSTEGKTDSETNVEYTLLWRHIAMQRQGVDDQTYMSAAIANLKNRVDWPYPLMEYSTGRLSEQQLEAASLRGAAEEMQARECEAAAYIGEWQLSHNQADRAEARFRSALAVCPFSFIERTLATHELKNISAKTSERAGGSDNPLPGKTPLTEAR